MNRPRYHYLIAGALLLLVVFACVWEKWQPVSTGNKPKTEKKTTSERRNEALVVKSSDIESSKLSEAQLQEYISFFEKPKLPHTQFHTATKVSIGQTIITQAYEGKPGEFVLTRFTPSVRTQSDSDKAPLLMEFETSIIDVSGNQRNLAKYPLKMFRTGTNRLSSASDISTPEGVYKVSIEAALISADQISVELSGGFFARKRKSNPDFD